MDLQRQLPTIGISKIVVRDIHRPSRGPALHGHLVWTAGEHGVEFLAYQTPDIDMCTAASKSAEAAGYKRWLAEESADARRELFERTHLPFWRPPFGYRRVVAFTEPSGKVRYTFEPIPEGELDIRKAYRMLLDGERRVDIARALGPQWNGDKLRDTLENPVYAGGLVYGRRVPTKHNPQGKATAWRLRRPPEYADEIVWNAVDPIVDRETWDAAQVRLQEASDAAREHRSVYGKQKRPLTGLLVCGLCGQVMAYHTRNKHRPKGTGIYYACPIKVQNLKARAQPCEGLILQTEGIPTALALKLCTELATSKVAQLILDDRERLHKARCSPKKSKARIRKLEAEKKKLVKFGRMLEGEAAKAAADELNSVAASLERLKREQKHAETSEVAKPTLKDIRAELERDRREIENALAAHAMVAELRKAVDGEEFAAVLDKVVPRAWEEAQKPPEERTKATFHDMSDDEQIETLSTFIGAMRGGPEHRRKASAMLVKWARHERRNYIDLERDGHPLIRKWVKRILVHSKEPPYTVELDCGETFEVYDKPMSST